jgi:hypothetical protein
MNAFRSATTFAAMTVAALLATACATETATQAVVDNDYPAPSTDATPATVVYRAWWATTYFPDAVARATESDPERTVPTTDWAYAVIAPGWDPSSADPPKKLIALKSATPLAVERGDVLHIRVSDATFVGNCGSNEPLSQADADFVTQAIFPSEFPGQYDAKTCSLTPSSDAGAGGGSPNGG